MAEVVPSTQQDFWRPPVAEPVTLSPSVPPAQIEVCDRCETEYIAGSRFCHLCGHSRAEEGAFTWAALVEQTKSALGHLQFQNIERVSLEMRRELGLSPGSLIAFLMGIFCVVAAIAVGLVFAVQTTLDWQALQLWRIEWLLGALVCFVAAILLKKSARHN
jgi:hypothetical protein